LRKNLLVLHLGSNLGNRFEYLQKAILALSVKFGEVLKQSGIYETKAWGIASQPDFLNMALVYETKETPLKVLGIVKLIEREIGRRKRNRWNEREIDIDIIFYGEEIVEELDLCIPHLLMHHRGFVLTLLNEIIPDFKHAILNKSVHQLYKECMDTLEVKPWKM